MILISISLSSLHLYCLCLFTHQNLLSILINLTDSSSQSSHLGWQSVHLYASTSVSFTEGFLCQPDFHVELLVILKSPTPVLSSGKTFLITTANKVTSLFSFYSTFSWAWLYSFHIQFCAHTHRKHIYMCVCMCVCIYIFFLLCGYKTVINICICLPHYSATVWASKGRNYG